MKTLQAVSALCVAAAVGAGFATSAKADEWNKKTTITFSGPVEIPGVHLVGWGILPAGTYVFKILDSQSDRHIVQIFNKDETIVYATILAIPNYRLKVTDKTVITFRERPAGQPEALRAWFYPGDNFGQEFVYGKAKAMELAKTSDTPVLFSQVETVEVAEPIASAAAPVVVEMKAAPVMALKAGGEEVALVEVVTMPAMEATTDSAAASASQPAASALPATASTLPLVGLFGLLALGGAMVSGRFANRA
jgi:hypothetical protein